MRNNIEGTERKKYLDVLRALSAMAVIVIHVSANNWYGYIGSYNWIVFTIYEGFAKVAVPIFFMISGCLLLNKEYTLRSLYSKIAKLLFFLFFWSFIYKLIQLPGEYRNIHGIINSIKEIILGNTQSHLWFIYSIIGLYMITPILFSFVYNSSNARIIYAIIIIFIVDSLFEMFMQFDKMDIITNNISKFKSGYSFGYIGYFLLGYYLSKNEFKRKKCIIIYILGFFSALITIGLVVFDCVTSQTLSERYWSYTMPFMVIYSCAWFIFVKNMCNRVNTKALSIITRVADLSLGIYGIHFIFILAFWKIGFSTFLFNGLFSVPIISVVVFVCSLITTMIIRKIPVIGKYIV